MVGAQERGATKGALVPQDLFKDGWRGKMCNIALKRCDYIILSIFAVHHASIIGRLRYASIIGRMFH